MFARFFTLSTILGGSVPWCIIYLFCQFRVTCSTMPLGVNKITTNCAIHCNFLLAKYPNFALKHEWHLGYIQMPFDLGIIRSSPDLRPLKSAGMSALRYTTLKTMDLIPQVSPVCCGYCSHITFWLLSSCCFKIGWRSSKVHTLTYVGLPKFHRSFTYFTRWLLPKFCLHTHSLWLYPSVFREVVTSPRRNPSTPTLVVARSRSFFSLSLTSSWTYVPHVSYGVASSNFFLTLQFCVILILRLYYFRNYLFLYLSFFSAV